MQKRRKFIAQVLTGTLGLGISPLICPSKTDNIRENGPMIISTWNHLESNKYGLAKLEAGRSALDAVEAAIIPVEADPKDMSVGYGGRPDREGIVTLDACIMDSEGNAGSVTFLQDIMHPISVARKVMEETPHVILSGDGAKQFALEQGFDSVDLLTDQSRKEYKKWLKQAKYQPVSNIENHDTIGLLALDKEGHLSGGCSTSGMAYKLHGRVGDSPIIGAGLFVDDEIGAATATGVGEMVLKTLGSFLIVELMRSGKSPQEACEIAVKRVIDKYDCKDIQVGYIAINKKGEFGAYAIQTGFSYTVTSTKMNEKFKAKSFYTE